MLTALSLLPFHALAAHARHGPPVPGLLVGFVVFFLWCVASVAVKSARRPGGDTRRRCTVCHSEHPGFARYCRQCGRDL